MFRKRRPPVGATPGAMAVSDLAVPTRIHVMDYNADTIQEFDVTNVEELAKFRGPKTITWIDVQGFGNPETIQQIGEVFELHPLAIADVVNVPNRPKAEDYEEYMFILLQMATMPTPPDVRTEQMGMFMGKGYVITFQQWYGDEFDPVRARIRSMKGNIRKCGSDYLCYAILDAVIDGYYPVLELLGEYLEELEDDLIDNPTREMLRNIYQARRELITVRRALWPQREVLNALMRSENALIHDFVQVYLRDCYDHCVQIIDVIENFRELAASFSDIYLSGMSNRLNEVMKVLTVISTIFMPLSFIAGVYGMNFKHMPELEQRWAYPAVLLFMFSVATAMLMWFRRNHWISLAWLRPKRRRRTRK